MDQQGDDDQEGACRVVGMKARMQIVRNEHRRGSRESSRVGSVPPLGSIDFAAFVDSFGSR